MHTLSHALRKAGSAEKAFKHKSILFIPSESYDAAAIIVLQGLEMLDFTIYTIQKPNINSWFCNEVIEDPSGLKYDFVLSNMHWGVRWDFYDKYNLRGRPQVLIDGCDNRGRHTWKDKQQFYLKKYKGMRLPAHSIWLKEQQPHRWMMDLRGYKSDVVFTTQKNPGDEKTVYLPEGIHKQYLTRREGKVGKERDIDFAHFPGPGDKKRELTAFLKSANIPGRVWNKKARGRTIIPDEIAWNVKADRANVHSWYRWVMYWDYHKVLNRTKILIYPGVYARPHWDAKRPWEALASDCLVLTEKPPIDMSEYPMTELCPSAVYGSLAELEEKCDFFYRNPGRTEQRRLRAVGGALKYFTPVPLARYFLWKIKGKL